MNILNKILLSGTLIIINVLLATGQTSVPSSKDSLVLDKRIKHGKLANGLSYYIKPINEPFPDISMYFLVNVGSNDELPHEINFAHHIEHIAFRETKNFPSGIYGAEEMLDNLDMHVSKLGAKTNIRSTNYYFHPPARKQTNGLSTGLHWFKDIAGGLNLSQESIDRERGVLLQEFRGDEAKADKNMAKSELYSNLFSCFNNYNKDFALRNDSFPYQDIQQFYKKWYQPDQMAVVVVGNIENIEKLELKIKKTFEDLNLAKNKIDIPHCVEEKLKKNLQFEIIERGSTSISITSSNIIEMYFFYKDPVILKDTEKESSLKRKLSLDIIISVLNERFKANRKSYNKNFKNISSHTTAAEIPPNTLTILLEAEKSNEKMALESTFKLLNQLKIYGITEEELEKAKEKKLGELPPTNVENSRYWEKEIINHFVFGEFLPPGKNAFLRKWLEQLSIEEINEIINQIIAPNPQDIGVIYPANSSTTFNSKKIIRKFIKEEFSKPVLPYKVPEPITSLFTEKQKDNLRLDMEIQSQERGKYVLQNGLTVHLEPDTTAKGSITIHGFSPQGASCFPQEEQSSTMFAPLIIRNAGIGDFTKFDLEAFYKNTATLKTGAGPYINYTEAGIKSEVSKEELEILLQAIYLYFTDPREDEEAFKYWKAEQLKYVASYVNPTNDLLEALRDITKDISTLPYASKRIQASQEVDLKDAYENYRKLFSNPGRFTFILSGDFEKKEILPLLQQYLGNIPSTGNFSCNHNKEEINVAKGPIFKQMVTSPFYKTENSFYGRRFVRKKTEDDTWQEEWKVRILGLIMENIIFDFRSKDGLSLYEIYAGGGLNRLMDRYEINFKYICLPEQLPLIREKTDIIINEIKSGKISEQVFNSQRNLLKSIFNPTYLNKSANVSKSIYRNFRYGESVLDAYEIETFFTELTTEDIIETARKYFKDEYLYEVKLEPIN